MNPWATNQGQRSGGWWSILVLLSAGLFLTGCLGTLPNDPVTRDLVLTPRAAVDLPLHETHRHWLFRDLPRWCGAAEARFGGDPQDRAVVTIRAARFRDATAAMRSYERLTPEYLAIAFRDRIAGGPRAIDYPVALPGDAKVSEYDVRLPAEIATQVHIVGQYIAVRVGRVVLLTESIGLAPEELAPVVETLVAAAQELGDQVC